MHGRNRKKKEEKVKGSEGHLSSSSLTLIMYTVRCSKIQSQPSSFPAV
jgi:hypothetical protein